MTLIEIIELLNQTALSWANVNSTIETGDIFDLNKEEFEQKYSAFCATQTTHAIEEYFTTFGFVLYYVDRLTIDKSNKNEIQSNAIQFFQYFIQKLIKEKDIEVEFGEVVTFTERFTAECAGAYVNCKITVKNPTLCATRIRETETENNNNNNITE